MYNSPWLLTRCEDQILQAASVSLMWVGWKYTHNLIRVKLWLTIESDLRCEFEQSDVLVISFVVIVLIQYDLLDRVGDGR